ncbi:MAG: GNAT family N-acetyltransferase [Bacteroidota bacterium]
MKLARLNISDEKYTILAKRYGSVFNSIEWLRLFGKNLVLIGIYNANNELIGAFFYSSSVKLGLKYALTPSYTPSIGFVIVNPAQNKSNAITFEKEVHEAISDYFLLNKYALVSIAFPVSVNDTQVYFWKKFKVIPNYTYQLSLHQDPNAIFDQFTSERRKSIKKAEKDQLKIERCFDNNIVFDLICKTFERKQKTINQTFVKKILFEFANDTNSFSFVAYDKSTPIATTFIIYDQNVAYYLFGGYNTQLKHHGAGPSCMWQSILHAKQLGLSIFDFEGSMLPEVEKYFREFGGEIKPYYTVHRGLFPIEVALKLKMRNKF